ncbi:alpha/beta hydrolase [Coraliomargarita sinensis]|uniref:Alpha/beta hydrolase n=1 Tax=Coraliomargarita sinensis TaxID=2174842 RepID=A0A317ZJZ0_9BACT|nr:alpha/beta hydrolase [Coraliomargarita sinensis]PXA04119.1 alpha/beta hydrolase [Coraliomargarita sinensis]
MPTHVLPLSISGFALLLMTACATTKQVPTPQTDIPYVDDGGIRQQGDLYLPRGNGPFPVAVLMHGGGWSNRDRSDMTAVSKQLAESGIAAFNINYRLAPKHHYPAQLNDVHAALRYLQDNAEHYRLDTSRCITLGYSAGAHLALLAAEIPDPEGPKISVVVAGGAPVDFSLYPKSPLITPFIGGSPQEFPEAWKEASPINHVTPEHPPVFLYHARLDILVQHKNARMMKAALENADVPVQLDTAWFYGHLLQGAHQGPAIRKAIDFVKKQWQYG